jgi:hypothetical protein
MVRHSIRRKIADANQMNMVVRFQHSHPKFRAAGRGQWSANIRSTAPGSRLISGRGSLGNG